VYEDVEFVIRLEGEMVEPEERDWEGDISINLDYRARRSHRHWLAERKRKDDFRIAWFRERTAEGCEQYWEEFEAFAQTQVQKWREEELIKHSIEDSEHETLIERGLMEIGSGLRDCLQTY
jgi:hypothetical protein